MTRSSILQPDSAHFGNQTNPPASGSAAAAQREADDRQWAAAIAAELIRERRRARLIRFAIYEALALALTTVSVIIALSLRASDDETAAAFRVVPIGCAILATIIPILFFAKPRRVRLD